MVTIRTIGAGIMGERMLPAALEQALEDGVWKPESAAMPNERKRPLEGVAQMTRGEPHHLATVPEAFEVQAVVEAILRA